MATGDSNDMLGRLKTLIPGGWFSAVAPIRDAIFGGLSDGLANTYALLGAVRLQTRIRTASGWFLDLIAWDFFGARFLRHSNESDDPWRARIIAEVLRERDTRKGITEALVNLTGRAPQIFEPWNPGDCGGGYGIGAIAYGGATYPQPVSGYGQALGGYGGVGGEFAYVLPNTYEPTAVGGFDASFNASFEQAKIVSIASLTATGAGCYGSLSYPFQLFVTAYRPVATGIPNLDGYGCSGGGYGVGTIAYASIAEEEGVVTDADIYAAVASSVAAGITAWTAIES